MRFQDCTALAQIAFAIHIAATLAPRLDEANSAHFQALFADPATTEQVGAAVGQKQVFLVKARTVYLAATDVLLPLVRGKIEPS